MATVQEQFEAFHDNNPAVYFKLVDLAREAKAKGYRTYAIKQLWGVLRWHYDVVEAPDDTGFKLNDLYYSRYARLIMNNEADLSTFFKTRTLRTV